MATIAIGDIHGNLSALQDVLEKIRGESGPDNTVVFLGDYIDRGPDAKGCVDAILAFRRQVQADVVCLTGNHEDWFLRTLRDYHRHSWLIGMEAFHTIRSYSDRAAMKILAAMVKAGPDLYAERCALPYEAFVECIPPDHRQFFEDLRTYCQTADCLCVHGGLDPRIAALDDQPRDALIWGAGDFPRGYAGDAFVVYGHHDNAVLNADGWPAPRIEGRTIGIDTSSHGILTAVRLPDRTVYQSARYPVADTGD